MLGRRLTGACLVLLAFWAAVPPEAAADSRPVRSRRGMVVAQEARAARTGAAVLAAGGNAVDAAVATAFVLAVTHPTAGNLGGGGFLVYRPAAGDPVAYDFRETAPAAADPGMWLDAEGRYDSRKHHRSHAAVGVPGTVAGLHLAWREQGSLPWADLLAPAIELARGGFPVSEELARSLAAKWSRLSPHPATRAQFGRHGEPLPAGSILRQEDLSRTLARIAAEGPAGFYTGPVAELLVAEMEDHGGLITHADLTAYRARRREPVRGRYRGCDVIGMPLPSSGGVVLVQMLNVLSGWDLTAAGFGSARTVHLMAETMRRAYAERARFLGDPEANPGLPLARMMSPAHADSLRASVGERSSRSVLGPVEPAESPETTHLSVVDPTGGAVALTTTLEYGYGSGIVVPGGGFLLNNEMGDFNAAPGLTDTTGLIGTEPNLARPRRRMLSSMSPTILTRDGKLLMVTGSLGGRTIINTVLQTIVNVVDHGMNAQEAVDAGRIHHQWLPDRLVHETRALSPDTRRLLTAMGHRLHDGGPQGVAAVIVVEPDGTLAAGCDRRDAGSAVGLP